MCSADAPPDNGAMNDGWAVDLSAREGDFGSNDYDLLLSLDEGVPKKNLLPHFVFDTLQLCEVTECEICCESPLSSGAGVRLMCGHEFHGPCIKKWVTECDATCPLCNLPAHPGSSVWVNASALDMDTGEEVEEQTPANQMVPLGESRVEVRRPQETLANRVDSPGGTLMKCTCNGVIDSRSCPG